ncbi:unnamed protein product [Lactuca virosa]|uniref:Uncharacterized protein n=1 Tax=Lactuca virosa TaxID=75947 RepID=A0AAU9N534_9ASTR|nr:unnamed protein product [Lactuca virosa]
MNFNESAPPYVSSGDFRNLKPDYAEEGEKVTAEAPPPNLSSAFIGSSQQQFPAVVQRTVPIVGYVAQAPELTALRPVVPSSNQLSGDSNREYWPEEVAGGGSHSDLVHNNKSVYGIVGPDSYGQAPSYTGLVERDRTSNGSPTNDVNFDPTAQAGFSMVGNKFRMANQLLNQYQVSE